MKPATLTHRPAPEYGPGVTVLTVDCRHGTTTLHAVAGENGPTLNEGAAAAMAVLTHYGEERCACTAPLWARVAPGQPPLAKIVAAMEGAA